MKILVQKGFPFRREGDEQVVTVGYGLIFAYRHTQYRPETRYLLGTTRFFCFQNGPALLGAASFSFLPFLHASRLLTWQIVLKLSTHSRE
jgi:hypothetical protein